MGAQLPVRISKRNQRFGNVMGGSGGGGGPDGAGTIITLLDLDAQLVVQFPLGEHGPGGAGVFLHATGQQPECLAGARFDRRAGQVLIGGLQHQMIGFRLQIAGFEAWFRRPTRTPTAARSWPADARASDRTRPASAASVRPDSRTPCRLWEIATRPARPRGWFPSRAFAAAESLPAAVREIARACSTG